MDDTPQDDDNYHDISGFLTPKELSKKIGFSVSQIGDMAKSGAIPCIKSKRGIGKQPRRIHRRYDLKAVLAALAEGPAPAPDAPEDWNEKHKRRARMRRAAERKEQR